jgi:tetratricopeptide (TPR) repeat protein
MDSQIDNDSTVYRALRIYRNSFFAYARTRLNETYGGELEQEIQSLFKKEWPDIAKSAIQGSATGVVQRQAIDSLDHLGVNHICVLLEKYWPYLCPGDDPKDEIGRKQRTQLTIWASELAAVRNPVAHPPTENLPLRDALRYVDTAARLLAVLNLPEAADLREIWGALIAESSSGLVEPPAVLDTLPSREQITQEFVGRFEELAILWRWLAEPDRRVYALVGDGGKGKTTIAFQFAEQTRAVLGDFGLQGVLWLTAKRRRFVEGITTEMPSTDFVDLDSGLNWILQALGWDEDIQGPIDHKLGKCRELLNEFPMLIIADDIDSLEAEEEQAVEFFVHQVPQTKSKVLITSRRRIFGLGGSTTVISGLSEPDVKELVRRRSVALGLDLAVTDRKARQIQQVTDGSPLYIEDLLRLAQFYSLDQALSQWAGRDGDSAREYSLRRELEKLSADAQNVLGVLAYSEEGLSIDECAVVWGITNERTVAAMDELRNWNLLVRPGFIEDVPRFSCSRNLGKLMRKALGGTDQETRVRNGIKSLRGIGIASSKTRGFVQQAVALKQGGHQEDSEKVLLQGLSAVPNSGEILSMMGWLYSKWTPHPRIADAEERFKQAEGLGQGNRHLYAHWADMEFKRGEFRKSADICKRAVNSVSKEDGFTWRLGGMALTKLGVLYRQSFQVGLAEEAFAKASDYLQRAQQLSLAPGELSRVFKARCDLAQAALDHEKLIKIREEWADRLPSDPFLEHLQG